MELFDCECMCFFVCVCMCLYVVVVFFSFFLLEDDVIQGLQATQSDQG